MRERPRGLSNRIESNIEEKRKKTDYRLYTLDERNKKWRTLKRGCVAGERKRNWKKGTWVFRVDRAGTRAACRLTMTATLPHVCALMEFFKTLVGRDRQHGRKGRETQQPAKLKKPSQSEKEKEASQFAGCFTQACIILFVYSAVSRGRELFFLHSHKRQLVSP